MVLKYGGKNCLALNFQVLVSFPIALKMQDLFNKKGTM